MDSFEFISPTRLVFGVDAEKNTGRLIKKYCDRALVVLSYGRTNASGIVDRTLASLKEAGVEYLTLDGVVTNPRLSKVHEGIDIVKREGIGFILAIGGGSIIDTAKAIGYGACYDGDVWDFYKQNAKPERVVPVGVVLTLAASGSEFSNSSVITNEATQEKLGLNSDLCRPVFAIENPTVLLSVPDYYMFCGIADIFAHILDRYETPTQNTDLVDRMAEGAMRCVVENSRKLKKDRQDVAALSELMLAGTFAHNGLFSLGLTGEWAAHGLGSPFSALYDSLHGATLTAVTPAWLTYIIEYNVKRAVQFAVRVWDVDPAGKTDQLVAAEGIARLKDWYRELGAPISLTELGVPTDDAGIAAQVAKYCERKPRGVCKVLLAEDAEAIYRASI